jgi:hypothetical protein
MFGNIGKLIASLAFALCGTVLTAPQSMAFSDSIFQIQSTVSPSQVVDQFGENITNGQVPAQMFNRNQTSKTSWLRRRSYGSGGSSELALNVCLSATTGLNQQSIKPGTPVVFRRDCTNSNNWLLIGDTWRPSKNTQYCVDAPNGNFGNFSKLQLFPCNGSAAQSFKINIDLSPTTWIDGNCFRRQNAWNGAVGSCFFTSDRPLKTIAHKYGPGFRVDGYRYLPAQSNRREAFTLGQVGVGGLLTLPSGIVEYSIVPWNVNTTSGFSVEK